MLMDLHIHEKTCSSDSFLDLRKIVRLAQEKGLQAIGITDHDSMGLYPIAQKVSLEMNFPILVGVEVLTYEGDLLLYGVDHIPDQKMHAQELINWTKERGGISIAAHPYRKNGRALGDTMFELKGLDGIEALNGNTPMALNEQAWEAALKLGLPMLGSSDAHYEDRVGVFATKFDRTITHMSDLLQEIRKGNTTPVYYRNDSYHSYDRERIHELAVS